MAAEAAGPPALRLCCLRLVASELLQAQEAQGGSAAAAAASGSLHAAVRALPSELQQELLLLLASWQLLDDASCEALAGPGGGGVLAGAAAASLAHCVLLGRPGLGRLFPSPLPQLQSLSLKGLLFLEDGDVAMVVQHLPALRQLDLSKNPRFTAGAVGAVAAAPAAPQLQSLSLAGCWQVDALPGLAERCRALTSLTLAGCWQLTNSVVRRVSLAHVCDTLVLPWMRLGSGCVRASLAQSAKIEGKPEPRTALPLASPACRCSPPCQVWRS